MNYYFNLWSTIFLWELSTACPGGGPWWMELDQLKQVLHAIPVLERYRNTLLLKVVAYNTAF